MGTFILVVLILFLVGALPVYPYSANWGYGPSGWVTVLIIVLVVLVLTGRLPR